MRFFGGVEFYSFGGVDQKHRVADLYRALRSKPSCLQIIYSEIVMSVSLIILFVVSLNGN